MLYKVYNFFFFIPHVKYIKGASTLYKIYRIHNIVCIGMQFTVKYGRSVVIYKYFGFNNILSMYVPMLCKTVANYVAGK